MSFTTLQPLLCFRVYLCIFILISIKFALSQHKANNFDSFCKTFFCIAKAHSLHFAKHYCSKQTCINLSTHPLYVLHLFYQQASRFYSYICENFVVSQCILIFIYHNLKYSHILHHPHLIIPLRVEHIATHRNRSQLRWRNVK